MSFTAHQWALALHLFGVILWVGSLVGLSFMLSSVAARDGELLAAARKVAKVMGIGALIAIVCGVYILIRTHSMGQAWTLKQPWMHIKLTVVVVAVIGGHGLIEARIKKLRRGGNPLPPIVAPVLLLAALAIVVLAIVRPLSKAM